MMDVDDEALELIKTHLLRIRSSLDSAVMDMDSSARMAKEFLSGNRMDIVMNVRDDDREVIKEATDRIDQTVQYIGRLQELVKKYQSTKWE